jgi:hypothetical protein
MTTRTSLVALAALAVLATTALSSTSASAWGAGHFAEGSNTGPGFGGAPNPAATHPDPHVPGATVSPSGGGTVSRPLFPRHIPTGMPNQTSGTPSASGQNGQGGWKPVMPGTTQAGPNQPSNGNGQNGWTPASQGHGPWTPGQTANNQPCGYGCGNGWNRWHHPYGPGSYVETVPAYTPPVYTQAPVYQAPVYQAPVQTTYAPPAYQAPVQTTYAPAPQTYVAPTAPTYAAAPSPAPCNCLTKSYTQDGSVVFADNCTKETAMAAPAGWQQGQTAPQQPN